MTYSTTCRLRSRIFLIEVVFSETTLASSSRRANIKAGRKTDYNTFVPACNILFSPRHFSCIEEEKSLIWARRKFARDLMRPHGNGGKRLNISA